MHVQVNVESNDEFPKFQKQQSRKELQYSRQPLIRQESSLSDSNIALKFESAAQSSEPNVLELVDHLLGITGWDLESALLYCANPTMTPLVHEGQGLMNRFAVSSVFYIVYIRRYLHSLDLCTYCVFIQSSLQV